MLSSNERLPTKEWCNVKSQECHLPASSSFPLPPERSLVWTEDTSDELTEEMSSSALALALAAAFDIGLGVRICPAGTGEVPERVVEGSNAVGVPKETFLLFLPFASTPHTQHPPTHITAPHLTFPLVQNELHKSFISTQHHPFLIRRSSHHRLPWPVLIGSEVLTSLQCCKRLVAR